MNISNTLTLARILLTVIFLFFIFVNSLNGKIIALVVFVAACLTDLYDGRLARKYNSVSTFGKIMDPVADKILVISAFFAFVKLGWVAMWVFLAIFLRELIVTGIRAVFLAKGNVLPAQDEGKHKTTFQMAVIIFMILFLIVKQLQYARMSPFFWTPSIEKFTEASVLKPVMLITVLITLLTGILFLYKNRSLFTVKRK